MGPPLTLPAQLAAEEETPPQQLVDKFRRLAHLPVRHAALPTPTRPPAHLEKPELVYVRRGGSMPPLTPPYSGPFPVLARTPKFFRLLIGQKEEVVSVDRLKPHTGQQPVEAPPPPSRRRPARLVSTALTYADAVAGGGPCSRLSA